MAAGWGNPKDDANATATRPTHVDTAAGVRRWYQNGLVPDAQDFNAIIAAMREVQDGAGIADAEGDDTLLLQAIQALTMPKLSGNTTFYVRSDGSDSNDGSANTAGAAWLTIQKAINVLGGYNLNGYTATVQVADGTYTGAVSVTRPFVNGLVVLVGNTTTPANCHLNVAGSCLSITRAQFEVKGFKLTASAGSCIAVVSALVDITGAMDYGAATGSHISSVRSSAVTIGANYTISGGAAQHYNVVNNSVVNLNATLTVTLSGTPAFSTAFCLLSNAGRLGLATYLTTFSGAATGIKYIIESNCEIQTTSGYDVQDQLPGSIQGVAKPRFDGRPALLNLLMNGNGLLQDGPSGTCADDTYGLHNRWYALTQTGAITPSSLSNVADGIPSMIRLTNTLGSAQRIGYAQIVEGINCRHLRGRQVTLNVKVRRSDGGNVRLAILEWTGTEDAVTSDIVNNWASATFTAGNFFASTTLTVASAAGFATTVAATLREIAATATISSSCNNIIVFVWTEGTITATTGTLDLTVQLIEGGFAVRFEHRPIQIERDLCARYYQAKTVRSENGSRHIPLAKMRSAPTVAVGVGSAANVTADGFELSHTAAADCTVTATAEL